LTGRYNEKKGNKEADMIKKTILIGLVAVSVAFSGITFSQNNRNKIYDQQDHITALGKIDEDNYVDLVVDGNVIFWGDSAGQYTGRTATNTPSRIYLVDYNRDGKLDLFYYEVDRDNYKTRVYVKLNQGNRNFTDGQLIFEKDWKYSSSAESVFTCEDLDGDGNLDLVFSWEGVPELCCILWGDQNNHFDISRMTDLGNLNFGSFIDLDNDGKKDWVYIGDTLVRFQVNRDFPSSTQTDFSSFFGNIGVIHIEAVRDVNKDGLLDVILSFRNDNLGIGKLFVSHLKPDRTFSTPIEILTSTTEVEGTGPVLSIQPCLPEPEGDLDADGIPDMITTKSVYGGYKIWITTLHEDLSYETKLLIPTYSYVGADWIHFADCNADGYTDLLIYHSIGTQNAGGYLYLKPEVKLTISVIPEGVGAVYVSPELPSYQQGELVSLYAFTIQSGYVFSSWSGSISSSQNPLSLTLDTDKDITANFVPYSGGGGGGGGCFVATACFGNYNHPFVKVLREFRDRYLLTNRIGTAFVRWYYTHSPKYAEIIKKNLLLKVIGQVFLTPFVILAFIFLKLNVFVLICLLFLGYNKTRRKKCGNY